MADSFDPYYKWLGISPQEQPPNHYRLLSINLFENDLDVIDAAADRQMAHLRGYQTGQHSAASQKLLNECSAARIALLNPDKKVEYDRQLREKLASVANAMRGVPGAREGSGFRVQGSAAETPAAALPRAKPLPQTQPPAEAAPLIDVGGSPSTGRPAARRRKARPAWQLPVIGAAAVALLAIVGWIASRTAKSPHEDQPPKTADMREVLPGPERISAPREPPQRPQATAAMPAAPMPPVTADPPTVGQPLTLVADASHRPETPGVVADRIVVWNLQMKDQGTRELNVALLRDEREVWRRDAIEIAWSPETAESVAIEIPPLRFDRVRVEITKWEQVRGGLAEIEVFQGDRNLARGCPTTGARWTSEWGTVKLTDGNTTSSHDGYWLLHDTTSGWAEIDLSFAEPRPCSGVLADTVTIWNTHNSHYNDRGALELNLRLFHGSKEVWRKDGVVMPWAADTDSQLQVELPKQRFDRLRIEIPRWQGQGGGLAEVQVHHGAANLAAGCPTIASGCYGFAFVPDKIVDGITTSDKANVGCWLPPDNALGWVEIDLSCNCPEIGKQNRDLGAYRALAENDWERGLPWLARASEAELRTLALLDALELHDPVAMATVGDGWWDIAAVSSGTAKARLLTRAAYRYAKSLFSIAEADRPRLDERVKQCLPRPEGTWLYLLREAEVSRVFSYNNLREPVAVGGDLFQWGLWMHPYTNESARAAFTLNGKCHQFKGAAAINDSVPGRAATPLTFKVVGDGRMLWTSSPLQKQAAWEAFDVNIDGVNRLELIVECQGPNGNCAAVWLDPILDPTSSWPGIAVREPPVPGGTAAATGSPATTQPNVTLAPGVTNPAMPDAAPVAESAVKSRTETQRSELDKKTATVKVHAGAARSPAELEALTLEYWSLVSMAIDLEDYERANRFVLSMVQTARKARDQGLLLDVQSRAERLRELRSAFSAAKGAQATLHDDAANAKANGVWGRYLAWSKAEWAAGLPLLAKGGDDVAKLASRELEPSQTSAAQVALADDWWQVAQGEKGLVKNGIEEHACQWYELALAGLDAADQQKARVKLERAFGKAEIFTLTANVAGVELGGADANIQGDATVEFWVSTKARDVPLLTKRQILDDQSLTFYLSGDLADVITDAPFNRVDVWDARSKPVGDGRWHHVAAIKRGKALSLTVDGNLAGEGRTEESLRSKSQWILGAHRPWNNVLRDGRFCRLRISTIARYHPPFKPERAYGRDRYTAWTR
ncbi:MAG TPA: NPCBM/NEW2 domain-containing protein [Pirellulales bacterium]